MIVATKHVFIDTQVFDQHHNDFTSPLFKKLHELTRSREVKLILTDVTVSEIQKHINKSAHAALKQLSNINKVERVVREMLPEGGAYKYASISEEQIRKRLHEEFQQFLKETTAEIVTVNNICPLDVFDRYFNSKPPFDGNGKKSEFPDAFAAAALRQYCNNPAVGSMFIVSDDGDWRRICGDTPEFTHVKSLSALLELFVPQTPTIDFQAIKQAVQSNRDVVVAFLTKSIEDADIYFYPDDSVIDGEIEDVAVLEIQLEDANVISAKDGDADVAVTCHLTVSMNVTGDDPDSMWHDDDDGEMHSAWKVSGNIVREYTIEGTVAVAYDANDLRKVTVGNATFRSEGIEVVVEEGELTRVYDSDDLEDEFDPMLPEDEEPQVDDA